MSALSDLQHYVGEHTRRVSGAADAPSVVDCHFIHVVVDEHFDRLHFRELVEAAISGVGRGEFGDITRDRLKAGPSYIEFGGWLGDQTLALMFMAAGQVAGLWTVITPKRLGFDGPEADEMAGSGFVMVSGFAEVSS